MSIALRGYWFIAAVMLVAFIWDAVKFGFDRLGVISMIVFLGSTMFVYMRREATVQASLLGLFLIATLMVRTMNWLGYVHVEGMNTLLISVVAIIGLIHCTCEARYQSEH